MATTQTFETIIRLNSQEAKNNLEQLRKKVDDLKAARDKAIQSKADSSFVKDLNKDLKAARAELRSYETGVSKTISTLQSLSDSSVKDIKAAMRTLKQQMDLTTDPEQYAQLQQKWEECRQRVDEFKAAVEASETRVNSLNATMKNLGSSSLNELTKASSILQAQLAGMNPQSDEYNSKAAQLATVRQRIDEINASQKAANTTIDKYNQEIQQATAKCSDLQRENELIDRTLKNISGSTMRDLEYSLKLVNEQLRGTKQGTEEYEKLTKSAKQLKTQIAAINDEQKEQKSAWSSMVDVFNVNFGAITQGIAALSGLSFTIRKCTDAYAEMNQEMYNVTKYTGQTIGQVEEMNEDFKKLDTRTSRIELNQLAEAAGRLGIQSKEKIEEFVDAADKINVALGDDLGQGAVDKIGKLATMFGESDRLGLRGAMLATGSAVNDLAQSSSANAGYIVDFTADLSGVASQANMAQSEIMGLASALDQNMQEEATSATVFSQLITKMFQNPQKFAKLAGMEVEKFTKLLNTDANEALLTFLQNMSNKGGFDALAPMFSEMGLEGTRAVGVLSAVASHLDQVRVAQQTAAQSYKEGTSVVDEFNVQNQTVQAELDKAKKAFNDLCVDLGEKLLPVARYTISTTSLGVKVLYELTMFIPKHIAAIAAVTTALLFYNGVLSVAIIKRKALTAATKIAEATDKAFTATQLLMKNALVALHAVWALLTKGVAGYTAVMRAAKMASLTNPWTALATVLTGVGVAVYYAVKALSAHRKAMHDNLQSVKEANAVKKLQASLSKEAAEKTYDEKVKIEQLTKIIRSNAYSVGERRKAVEKLQEIIPDYHASISKEGQLYNENTKAIKDFIAELDRAALAQAIYSRKVEINKQKLSLEFSKSKAQGSLKAVFAERQAHPQKYSSRKTPSMSAYSTNMKDNQETNGYLISNKKQEEIHKKRIATYDSELKIKDRENKYLDSLLSKDSNLSKAYNKVVLGNTATATPGSAGTGAGSGSAATGGKGGKGGSKTDPNEEKYKKESEALKKHLDEEQLALSQQLQGRKITEEQFDAESYKQKQDYYAQLFALQTKYGKDSTATQQAMVDASMAEAKRLAELDEQHMKESLDARLRSYDEEQMALIRQRTSGQITEEEYNEKLKQAEILYHQDRLAIIQEYGGDELQEQKWLLDQELEDLKQTEEEKRNARLDTLNHKLETTDSYDGQRAVIQKMYDEQLITYEDYQDKMTQIAQQKAQARQAVMQQAFDSVNQMLSAASQYSQACSDLEVARITANYDKQIEAAGNNSKKKKKLEEQRDKEIAAAKKKANKRAMVMELAQAVASTAMAAINAYSSAAQVPFVGYILAPIAAATATAAGLLQIATIKKQHQTQEATGYYEGGFTGGKRYRREAGVVHEGEFVANHMAVNNARILPALQLIDQAQRNNTVGRLTEADVSRALGQNATVVSAPNITVNSSSDELTATMGEARDVIDRLSAILAAGIHASVSIDGPDGVAHQYDTFNKMNSRK